jgi:hypothetical protein
MMLLSVAQLVERGWRGYANQRIGVDALDWADI